MPNEVLIKIRVKDETDYEPTLAKAREFGQKVKEALNEAATINVKVDDEEAKVKIKEIEAELARLDHDDASIKIKVKEEDVKAATGKVKSELKKDLEKAGSEGGNSFGKKLLGSLQSFDFKPGLLPVGLAVGAAFLPLIGAGIAGIIVGGLGLGGIVGGVMVAAKDARVKSAFTSMKHDLGAALKVDTAPFVPVVIEGIGQIERVFKAIDLKGIFKDLAPQVAPVLTGVLSLITSLGESIRNIARNSGPVLKELGTDFRNLGNTLEAGLNSLTDNSGQEASALHDLFGVIDGAITIVFDLVNALTEMYGVWHKIFELSPAGFYTLMQDHSQKLTGLVHQQVSAVVDAVNANHDLADSSAAAAQASAEQAAQITNVADALKAATDPAFAMIDAQRKVNAAQTAYNKAVKSGGENSAAAKKAQEDLEKALINYVGAAGKARAGTGHLTDEQKALLKAAGASDKTIKALDTQLNNAYKSAKKLDGFNIDITVNEIFKQTGKYISPSSIANPTQLYSGLATGGIKGAASGATSSDWTWVGENGPELRKLPPGTAVRSHGDSMRMAGGSGGGGSALQVNLVLDGHVIAGALVDPQRKFVQQNFGGSVQAAYGVGA